MDSLDPRIRLDIGSASLELPEALLPKGEAVDSPSTFFEGSGMSVLVDQGPFSNPLTALHGNPEYEESERQIAGRPAWIISYRDPDGDTYTVAAHIPELNRLTVVVRATSKQIAEEIIQSIKAAEST